MTFIEGFKKLFGKNENEVDLECSSPGKGPRKFSFPLDLIMELWDTSSASNYSKKFKEHVLDPNRLVMITEGTIHEFSNGKSYSNVRDLMRFISTAEDLVFIVTPDEQRSWAVDEQIISVVEKLDNAGYNITLVTCDKDQAFKAKTLKGLKVEYLEVIPQKKVNKIENKEKPREKKEEVKDLKINSYIKGKTRYVAVQKGIAVYDKRGQRKIPNKDQLVEFNPVDDKIVCYEKSCKVIELNDNEVIIQFV